MDCRSSATAVYDLDNDALYLTYIDEPGQCRRVECPGGLIIQVQEQSGQIARATVLNFLQRELNGEALEFPELKDCPPVTLIPPSAMRTQDA